VVTSGISIEDGHWRNASCVTDQAKLTTVTAAPLFESVDLVFLEICRNYVDDSPRVAPPDPSVQCGSRSRPAATPLPTASTQKLAVPPRSGEPVPFSGRFQSSSPQASQKQTSFRLTDWAFTCTCRVRMSSSRPRTTGEGQFRPGRQSDVGQGFFSKVKCADLFGRRECLFAR
jgi:hypothetical protein